MNEEYMLTMRGIGKRFPGVTALDSVDFSLNHGEIHALMGENGAGKSTLIKVLTGVYQMDNGTVYLKGKRLYNQSPEEAQRNGISTVYQEINLCPNISVAENIYAGRQPRTRFGSIDWKEMNTRARAALAAVGLDIDVGRALGEYSVAIQQMVSIARAVDFKSTVLILDEPTSSLDDQEVHKLFEVMRSLKASGVGIIFVTHFLEQVYEICDCITVLRNGKLVGRYSVSQLPRIQLVSKMLGHEFDELAHIREKKEESSSDKNREVMIQARRLGRQGMLKPFDLEIHKGEVVGLSGLLGSGRSELARLLYCAEKPDHGEMYIQGQRHKAHNPIDSMRRRMAFLPEDRKEEGIIDDLSVRENLVIALQARTGMFRLLPMAQQNELAEQFIKLLNIKTPSPEALVRQLSGGNQQKVILGRWLITNPEFLILDEPTRGIDVGTKTEIQKLILRLASEGMTVMFISSEIEEMLRTVDRLVVMCDRQKCGELDNDSITEQDVMAAIAGGSEQ